VSRPWWSAWQHRDLPLVVVSIVVVVGFLAGVAYLTGHVMVLVMDHIQKALNHPN